MSQYDIFQQVFGLNLASNLVAGCPGRCRVLQEKLTRALFHALPKIGPGWNVVWGPVIWKPLCANPLTRQGNAWFVAKNNAVTFNDNTTRCVYVIAIAGTSGIFDWFHEDFDIYRVVDVDKWAEASSASGVTSIHHQPIPIDRTVANPNRAHISYGFAGAVYQLLNRSPPTRSPGAGQTLPQFLQGLPRATSGLAPKLVVTGHSLGGALAPALAYTLLKANALGPFAQSDVVVYPTAGPSPGNKAFADAFSDCFPSSPQPLTGYQHWNANIVSTLDIVPCAYCMTKSYTPLYFPNTLTLLGSPPPLARWKINQLMVRAGNFYIPLKASFFTSVVPYPSNPSVGWLPTVRVQHVLSYTKAVLNIDTFTGVCSISEEEDLVMRPVLGAVMTSMRGHEETALLEDSESAEVFQALLNESFVQ